MNAQDFMDKLSDTDDPDLEVRVMVDGMDYDISSVSVDKLEGLKRSVIMVRTFEG